MGQGFLHPKLRLLLGSLQNHVSIAECSAAEARAWISARTAGRPPGPEVREVRDLLAPSAQGGIPLRLYRPRDAQGVVVVFHGGGWLMGDIASFDSTCRHLAVDSGAAVVSVGYRLAPEYPFPAAIDDAWDATRWVASHGEIIGVDTRRLAVLGESAGGNLAAVVCLMARDAGGPAISFQVLVYPPVDARLSYPSFEQFATGYLQTKRDVLHAYRVYGLGTTARADDWRLSPLLAASHEGLPPALILSAEDDPIRDDSESYHRRLLEAGVAATHVRYAHMFHTFFGMRGLVVEAEMAQMQAAASIRNALGREQ